VGITEIGHIIRNRKMALLNPRGKTCELQPQGWEHFKQVD